MLGFPCNQFGGQEPGTNAEILEFARSRYDANFPMFEKVKVKGKDACDLYRFLTSRRANPKGKAEVGWNFTKFLVDGNGDVLARYEPGVTPEEIGRDLGNHGL